MKFDQKFAMMKLQIIQANFSDAAVSPSYDIIISCLFYDSNDFISVDYVSVLMMFGVDLNLKVSFFIMADRRWRSLICKLYSLLNGDCSCWKIRAIVVGLSSQFYQVHKPFTSHLPVKDPIDFFQIIPSKLLAFHSHQYPSHLSVILASILIELFVNRKKEIIDEVQYAQLAYLRVLKDPSTIISSFSHVYPILAVILFLLLLSLFTELLLHLTHHFSSMIWPVFDSVSCSSPKLHTKPQAISLYSQPHSIDLPILSVASQSVLSPLQMTKAATQLESYQFVALQS